MSTPRDVMELDDLEANVERVFRVLRGLREDTAAFVLAIAQYALLRSAAQVHSGDNEAASEIAIAELFTLTTKAGREYALAMIAEGHIRFEVRADP